MTISFLETEYFRQRSHDCIHFPDWKSASVLDYLFGVFMACIIQSDFPVHMYVYPLVFEQIRLYVEKQNHMNEININEEEHQAVRQIENLDPEYFRACWTPDYHLSGTYRVPEWQNGVLHISDHWLFDCVDRQINSLNEGRVVQRALAMTICGHKFRLMHVPKITKGFDSVWNIHKNTSYEKSSGINSLLKSYDHTEIADLFSRQKIIYTKTTIDALITTGSPMPVTEDELYALRQAILHLPSYLQYKLIRLATGKRMNQISTDDANLCFRHGVTDVFRVTRRQRPHTNIWEITVNTCLFDKGIKTQLGLFLCEWSFLKRSSLILIIVWCFSHSIIPRFSVSSLCCCIDLTSLIHQ